MTKIWTVFDEGTDHPGGAIHANTVHYALRRLVSDPFFFDQIDEEKKVYFQQSLPFLKWSHQGPLLSLFFLSPHRLNIGKFFYEIVHRWLMPGRRLDVPFFFTTDFRLPEMGGNIYTIAEMIVRLPNEVDIDQIVHNLHIIETEVRLGMVSVYHASKILEIHGRTADEKGGVIQEKISKLIQMRPDDVDYDIFGEMQHFFVMSSDEFKLSRDAHHLSRLIAVFYLFHKSIEKSLEQAPDKRHIHLKLAPVRLEFPWGVKKVLAICVGLNLLKRSEFFEERHLLKAVQNLHPGIQPVEGSFFTNERETIHTLYLEVEKEDSSEFSKDEVRHLRKLLPDEFKRSIEVALRPLFMPRNEEEVMRHIVTLSGQLRYVRDLPQVILSFDEQTESELAFNVILVRILLPNAPSVASAFSEHLTFLRFFPDRVKRIGMVRKRYPKEAAVFRVSFDSTPYLRNDHSVDIYKARQDVIAELQRIFGEVRDYNGGMITKQLELLEGLKTVVSPSSRSEQLLLEKFFHSLFPIEMRSICPVEALKILFHLWKELLMRPEEREVVFENEEALFFMFRGHPFHQLDIPDTQLVMAKLEEAEEKFLGYIYFSRDKSEREAFLSAVDAKEITV